MKVEIHLECCSCGHKWTFNKQNEYNEGLAKIEREEFRNIKYLKEIMTDNDIFLKEHSNYIDNMLFYKILDNIEGDQSFYSTDYRDFKKEIKVRAELQESKTKQLYIEAPNKREELKNRLLSCPECGCITVKYQILEFFENT